MPASMVSRFDDPDVFAAAIRASRTEIAVTERGRFAAKLIRIDLHRLWMQRGEETLGRISHVDCVPGRAIIWFSTKAGPTVVTDRTEVPAGAIVRNSDGYSCFQRSTGGWHKGSMSLPIADMEALGATYSGSDLTPPRDALICTPLPAALERLQRLHAAAGHLAEYAPEVIAHPEAARGLEQALTAAMADCFSIADCRSSGAGNGRHNVIMRRFFAILEANPDGVLYVPEICGKIGVSKRTLTTYCNEALGMSPMRYFKLRQLNLARRALAAGDPAATTVTRIATAYGFWELGRFAVAYRTLFGERPSVTLARPRGAAPIPPDRINSPASSLFA